MSGHEMSHSEPNAEDFPVSEYRTTRRIEFADTDLAGIVHFARFFVFMETAEHELLRRVGMFIHEPYEGQLLGWPRVSATCEYLSPARFRDELDIIVRVARKGHRSMTYAVEFKIGDRPVAKGRISSVCCDMRHEGNGLKAIPIPESLAERLSESPALR